MNKFSAFFAAIGAWVKNAAVAIVKWFKNWAVPVDGKEIIPVRIAKWFKSLFVATDGLDEPRLKTLAKSKKFQTILASVLCAVAGLILGFVVMLFISPAHAGEGILTVIKNFLNYKRPNLRSYYFGSTLVKAAPLILCGLSVLFAYKAGLFNIGAAGQYTVGICACLFCALAWNMPWYLCVLFAILVGGLWGALSGALKAVFGINEVIACIMTNWIGLYLTNIILADPRVMNGTLSETHPLASNNPDALLPSLGLDKLFNNNQYVTIALIITIIVAVAIKIVLDKTTFGYELKATGLNKHAAKYVGMKDKRNVILTMAIAGGLAGLAAAMYYLTGIQNWKTSSSVPAMGFNGIAVAFLGGLDPIGTIFAGYFIQHITSGGGSLDTAYFNPQVADLIVALIIYLCAFVLLFRDILAKRMQRKAPEQVAVPVNDSSATDEEEEKEEAND